MTFDDYERTLGYGFGAIAILVLSPVILASLPIFALGWIVRKVGRFS